MLDLALAGERRSIVVVGTAKNAGKTVTFNALRAAALRRGITGAVSSIGRDGEPGDALDGRAKPRVRLESGTIVALPRALVPASPALHILDLGEASALGSIVFARVMQPLTCEIGGPPSARGLRATIDRLCELAAAPAFIDGAIDRIAPLAGGDDAIVVATGAASGATIEAVAAVARDTVRRLSLPGREPASERAQVIAIDGALDALDVERLMAGAHGATVVLADPTRIAVRGKLLENFMAAFDLRCEKPLHLVAVTTSSVGPGSTLDPRRLLDAVARATGLPAFDVVAELVA
ncbi:MAG: hypothetical protein NVS3B28_00190 [Candidatus Velthaea sp.]